MLTDKLYIQPESKDFQIEATSLICESGSVIEDYGPLKDAEGIDDWK